LGQAGEKIGHDKKLKVNKVKIRGADLTWAENMTKTILKIYFSAKTFGPTYFAIKNEGVHENSSRFKLWNQLY